MASSNGKLVTIYDIPKVAKIAFESSLSSKNINSAFKCTGIWPINELVFTDAEFEANYVGDHPDPESTIPESNKDTVQDEETIQEKDVVHDEANAQKELLETKTVQVLSPASIRPFPKAERKTKRTNRERGKSRIYTDTPEKKRIATRKQKETPKIRKR